MEGEEKGQLVITFTGKTVTFAGYSRRFDPVDDIMFVPLHAPKRQKHESDSLQIDIIDWNNPSFTVDLAQWENEETRDWIVRKILKAISEDIWNADF